MNRFVRIPFTFMACVVWAGLALAQAAAARDCGCTPAGCWARGRWKGWRAGGSATRSRPGWLCARAGRDWSAGAGAAGGRHSSSDTGGAGAGQRRRQEVHRQRHVVDQTAVEEVRVAADASTGAHERRRHVHADGAAAGTEARGVRRDREAGQHRSAAARRLDHRLVGAGRRQQGDVRQVLRRRSGRRTSRSPATRRRACSGGSGTAKGRAFSRRRSC